MRLRVIHRAVCGLRVDGLSAFAGAGTDEIGSEFGDHGEDVKSRSAGSAGSWTDPPMPRFTLRLVRSSMIPRACERPGDAVEFGDHESVASA